VSQQAAVSTAQVAINYYQTLARNSDENAVHIFAWDVVKQRQN